jgi:hypothetical protein
MSAFAGKADMIDQPTFVTHELSDSAELLSCLKNAHFTDITYSLEGSLA